jgi:HAMP domain-containing protein
MMKSLAAKTIIPVACSVTGFVVVCCILLYSNLKQDRIDQNIVHASDLGSVLVKATRDAMLKVDRGTLRNIVADVGAERMVEHVRIFNKQGVVVFAGLDAEVGREVDKDAEGCSSCHSGRDPVSSVGLMEQARRYVTDAGIHVLAVTTPIYNEGACSSAECHYHPTDQTVLGTLDIGLSEEPFLATLRGMRRQFVLFSLMILLLSVGGVVALLQMNVVVPLRQLLAYIEAVRSGRTDVRPPATNDQLAAIGQAFEELRQRLAELEQNPDGGTERSADLRSIPQSVVRPK